MSKRHHSANDQRSIAKNPNNAAYRADVANRSALGHPNVPPPPQAPPPASGAVTTTGSEGDKK